MRKLDSSTRIRAVVLILSVMTFGCTEAPTSPSAVRAVGPRLKRLTSEQNGSQISISDDYGSTYTLDVDRNRITRDDGVVIDLTPEETVNAANQFSGIVISDTRATMLQNVAPPCPPDQDPCVVEPNAAINPSSAPGSPFLIRRVKSHPRGHRPKKIGRNEEMGSGEAARSSQRPAMASPSTSTSESTWPPSCLDIARAINDEMPRYRAVRNAVTNTLADIANPRNWMSWDENGYPHVTLRALQDLALDFDQNAAPFEDSMITLYVLGSMYTGYGCWTNDWPDAQRPATGGLARVCDVETWQISTDGGNTWQAFNVETCSYENPQ